MEDTRKKQLIQLGFSEDELIDPFDSVVKRIVGLEKRIEVLEMEFGRKNDVVVTLEMEMKELQNKAEALGSKLKNTIAGERNEREVVVYGVKFMVKNYLSDEKIREIVRKIDDDFKREASFVREEDEHGHFCYECFYGNKDVQIKYKSNPGGGRIYWCSELCYKVSLLKSGWATSYKDGEAFREI